MTYDIRARDASTDVPAIRQDVRHFSEELLETEVEKFAAANWPAEEAAVTAKIARRPSE